MSFGTPIDEAEAEPLSSYETSVTKYAIMEAGKHVAYCSNFPRDIRQAIGIRSTISSKDGPH